MEKRVIKLQGIGREVETNEVEIMECSTIQNLLEDLNFDDDKSELRIPIPSFSSSLIQLVVNYCKLSVNNKNKLNDNIKEEEEEIINNDKKESESQNELEITDWKKIDLPSLLNHFSTNTSLSSLSSLPPSAPPSPPSPNFIKSETEEEFFKEQTNATLLNLISISNFLEHKKLLQFAIETLAKRLMGQSVDSMRQTLNISLPTQLREEEDISHDFSTTFSSPLSLPSWWEVDEKEIHEKNQWCLPSLSSPSFSPSYPL